MQILKKEEMPKILPIKGGRDSKLRVMLLQLEIGEGLFMSHEEWKRKKPPYQVVSYIKKSHGRLFKYGKKADGSGWIFKRIA